MIHPPPNLLQSTFRQVAIMACAATLAGLLPLPGCSSARTQQSGPELARDLNAKGIADKDPKAAKRYFQHAAAADVYFGPAYNNLGIVYLNEENFFEAARCFDQAQHLMPDDPAPRIHLGLVYEQAGQFQNALGQYNQALVIAPESMDALQAATRAQVRLEEIDEKTISHLRAIAMRGTDSDWQAWATRVLVRFGDAGSSEPSTTQQ